MRTAMVVAILLSCVVVVQAADDWAVYRPQVEALLADEAAVPIEIGERWNAWAPASVHNARGRTVASGRHKDLTEVLLAYG